MIAAQQGLQPQVMVPDGEGNLVVDVRKSVGSPGSFREELGAQRERVLKFQLAAGEALVEMANRQLEKLRTAPPAYMDEADRIALIVCLIDMLGPNAWMRAKARIDFVKISQKVVDKREWRRDMARKIREGRTAIDGKRSPHEKLM